MPQIADEDQAQGLTKKDWDSLVSRIHDKVCTPIIGPGACNYCSKSVLAREWIRDEDYPFEDQGDMARVAQFLAVQEDDIRPKERLIEFIKKAGQPNFKELTEPHSVLASLELPLYITTNYDSFMVEALKAARKDVRTEHCRWRKKFEPYDMNMIGSQPSVANPLVFHLYGYADNLKSLVLTENDYIEFLMNLSGEERIPGIIKAHHADTSLVFLGYQLDDWDFRILYHTISRYLAGDGRKSYVTVQLDPPNEEASTKQRARAKKIFDYYFNERKVRVFWGTCADFMLALKEHMRGRSHDH